MAVTKRALKPKVTVASVKRKWEEKYAELSIKYDALAKAHLDLACLADKHFDEASKLQKDLDEAHKITLDALAHNLRQEGIISYIEKQLAKGK